MMLMLMLMLMMADVEKKDQNSNFFQKKNARTHFFSHF